MTVLVVVVGAVMVLSVTVDMVNTLVATSTSTSRWWLSSILYRRTWTATRAIASRVGSERQRERLLATFAPVSVLMLLLAWVIQQVVGFGLIWWGLGGIDGANSLFDSVYYSGVVYFTLGFGELVPAAHISRLGALVEALSGVLTTALVIGYLPSLYGAYSERERMLMTIDDGTEQRITPTNLLLSRAPTGDVDDVLRFFEGWEMWVTGVLETHTTFPMLRLFRSKHPGQNWITALGLLCDTALHCQMMVDAKDRAPYWLIRRSIMLFDELTQGADLSDYRAKLDATYQAESNGGADSMIAELYQAMQERGFELLDFDEARTQNLALRRLYDAKLEYLIDVLLAPRGFWGHKVGHRVDSMLPSASQT